jgi:hypothetical protein
VPPPWSAPRGWPSPFLDALRQGEAVSVSSSQLLRALMHARLPHKEYAYGGALHGAWFVLDSDDMLTLCED